MRFKLDGISVDHPYAQLKVLSVPDSVDVLHPFFLRNIDETSWKSLSGVRANQQILRLVLNLENFQSMLRCIKLWAKRRGVYGNLNGFLGGVHLAILAAFVCQNHLNASVSVLISIFFSTFAIWPWPTPVVLQDGRPSPAPDQDELGDWVDWVKSRFRGLLLKLEGMQGNCDPSPNEYVDEDVSEPNVVFYWGLNPNRNSFTDIESAEEDFSRNIYTGYHGNHWKIELSIVKATELPKNVQISSGSGKKMKAYWRVVERRTPVYSQHMPDYLVGYLATNEKT